MATTPDIKNLNNDLEKAKESFDELLFASRDFSNEIARAAKNVFNNKVQASEQAKTFKTLASLSKEFASQISDITDGTKSISDLNKVLIKQEETKKKFNVEYRQVLAQIEGTQGKINKEQAKEQEELLNYYKEQDKVLQDQATTLDQVVERAKNIEGAFGGAGIVVEGLETVLNKLGASKLTERLGISKAIVESRQFAANLTSGQTGTLGTGQKIANQFKVLGNLAGNVGGNLVKSLGPVPLIIGAIVKIAQFFVKSMFEASVQTAEFQRDMGLTADEANKVRSRTFDIAKNSSLLADTQGRVLITQKQIVQSQKEINDALDTQIDLTQDLGVFGQELLAQSSILRDNFGLGAEAIAEIDKEAIRTGDSVEDITKNTFGTIAAVGLEKGILLDVNKILSEATKIQGNLRLSFKGSTAEIANAVAQSKLLGLTLQQNASIADNLLNFEQSISSELEAELLTGRELNLEKARLAALNGDFLQVGKEINAQGITYNNLQKMNLIQRKAIASAVGLSVDELADATKKQEEYNALQARALTAGVKISDLEKKTLKELYDDNKALGRSEEEVIAVLGKEIFIRKQAEDAQTKFNKALDSAKESFAKLAESKTIDKFADILTKFISTVQSEGLIGALFGDYKSDQQILQEKVNAELKVGKGVVFEETKEEIKTKGLELKNNRVVSPEQVDDFILRPGQKPIKYNKDDIIIGGTNLDGGNTSSGNNEMISLLKELISAVKSEGNVYLDGTKVGTAMAVSTYRVQ
jgi:hypothetical protein